MLVFAVLAVFIAGLMIGRTPEYLGKKIEAHEMKMVSIAILVTPLLVLLGTAIAVMAEAGRAGILNPGAHGLSEVLYALSSAGNNNGSAFAGLSANTPFYNTALAVCMFFARYWIIVPVLAMAGSIAGKKKVPTGAGTLPTHDLLFVLWLVGVVIVIGALTFFPAMTIYTKSIRRFAQSCRLARLHLQSWTASDEHRNPQDHRVRRRGRVLAGGGTHGTANCAGVYCSNRSAPHPRASGATRAADRTARLCFTRKRLFRVLYVRGMGAVSGGNRAGGA
jgi:hypothetical protein